MTHVRWWLVFGLVACSGGTKTDTGDDDDTVGDDDDTVGDDDDDVAWDGECEDAFSPCGGDPTGQWNVVGVCEAVIDELDCDGLAFTVLEDRTTGTVAMNGDNTYDRVYNVDVDLEIEIPLTCIDPVPCALLPGLSGGVLATCTEDATTCTCSGTVTDVDSADGTWVVEGDEIVFDGGDRQAFCVTGDHAVVRDPSGVRTNWVR
jgi:hypothetical protein